MPEWEYRLLEVNWKYGEETPEALSIAGGIGWEAVGMHSQLTIDSSGNQSNAVLVLLKRKPVTDSAPYRASNVRGA